MRPAVLSISTERVLAPIRNAVLAHAGYGVIPAVNAASALDILRRRHVCAMIIGQSISAADRHTLCCEGQRLGIPSVVLDSYDQSAEMKSEIHVNPLDGPETFLDVLASVMRRDHMRCARAPAAKLA